MGISKNVGNWHLEGFLCYFTCLNLIFVKILGNFQQGHHYYCLTVIGHVPATTSSNEYAKWPTLDFTIHDDMCCVCYQSTYNNGRSLGSNITEANKGLSDAYMSSFPAKLCELFYLQLLGDILSHSSFISGSIFPIFKSNLCECISAF